MTSKTVESSSQKRPRANRTPEPKGIKQFLSDFRCLTRICGPLVAVKWLVAFVLNFPEVLRTRNLQPADRAVGNGPFTVKIPEYGAHFKVGGPSVISGIREMYVRDCYLEHGLLNIEDGDVVVDLGANLGLFTSFALANGKNVRVVSVEPSKGLNEYYKTNLSRNPGFLPRATLIRAFLGEPNFKIAQAIQDDPNYLDVPWMNEEEIIDKGQLKKIDFLKCDIEGGEFSFLSRNSKLLAMTKMLAIEIHSFAGDVGQYIKEIKLQGFRIVSHTAAPDGSCVLLAQLSLDDFNPHSLDDAIM